MLQMSEGHNVAEATRVERVVRNDMGEIVQGSLFKAMFKMSTVIKLS